MPKYLLNIIYHKRELIMKIQTLVFYFGLVILSNCMGKVVIQSSQPHNKNCYTQGIFFLNSSHLFESCGLYGQSYFHVMEYQSTPFEIRQSYSTLIPWKASIFLEGAVMFKGYIYLLTWKQRIVYKINPTDFSVVRQISWAKDGWGLTTNGTHMFTTDGSNKIYVVNENFSLLETKQIKAKSGASQQNINELQYVEGYIYANIYMESKIVKISLEQGKVVAEYNGDPAIQAENGLQGDEVINGIAYDTEGKKFIITGKHWSKIHQATFVFQTVLSICALFSFMTFSI